MSTQRVTVPKGHAVLFLDAETYLPAGTMLAIVQAMRTANATGEKPRFPLLTPAEYNALADHLIEYLAAGQAATKAAAGPQS